MRLSRFALFLVLLSPVLFIPAYAQRGGGGHSGGGARAGGGGGGFHGGVSGTTRSGGSFTGGFRSGGGSFNGGFAGNNFHGGFSGNHGSFHGGFVGHGSHFGSTFFFGYAYPYYYGYGYPYYYGYGYPYYGYGGYPYPYGYGYGYDPGYYGYDYGATVSTQAPAYAAPPNYGTAPQQQGSYNQTPDYYLIAFNDHTIQAAVTYSIDGDTLRWTTREGQQLTAPLSSVDRRFSEQINRDRNVQFRLP